MLFTDLFMNSYVMFKALLTVSFLVALSYSQAFAYRPSFETATCPIDGEVFKYKSVLSATELGKMLDLKPYGFMNAPWPLPKCPTTGFVMYKSNYTPDEIEYFRNYVSTQEYKKMADQETIHYLAARLKQANNEQKETIAYSFLKSTWEARTDSEYSKYANATIHILELMLEENDLGNLTSIDVHLLLVELHRRIENFDQAARTLYELDEIGGSEVAAIKQIVDLQLELIEKQDNSPHKLP